VPRLRRDRSRAQGGKSTEEHLREELLTRKVFVKGKSTSTSKKLHTVEIFGGWKLAAQKKQANPLPDKEKKTISLAGTEASLQNPSLGVLPGEKIHRHSLQWRLLEGLERGKDLNGAEKSPHRGRHRRGANRNQVP